MKIKINLLVLIMALFSSTVQATESSAEAEVLLLRKQLEELKAGYIRQAQAINILESSLQKIEADKKAPVARQASPSSQQPAAKTTTAAQAQQPAPKSASASQAQQTPQAQAQAQAGAGAGAKEETVVKEAPRNTSVSTVIQEQHGLFGKRFSLEAATTYSRFNRAQINLSGFLALDAIFLGRISVDEIKSDVVTSELTARYGIFDRIQVDFNAPFLYRNTNYFKGNVGGETASAGEGNVTLTQEIGDVNAGILYQVLPETVNWPDIVVNVRAKAPTGSDPYGIGTHKLDNGLIVPEKLPSGTGVWSFSTGLSFAKTIDPAVLFFNLNYFYNFQGNFDNIGGNTPTPGTVDLGSSYQFGLGMAFALNERLSMNFSYTQRLVDQSRIKANGGQWNSIIGSDVNVASLSMGVTFALTQHLTIVTNVGVGLTSDAPDVQLGFRIPYQF